MALRNELTSVAPLGVPKAVSVQFVTRRCTAHVFPRHSLVTGQQRCSILLLHSVKLLYLDCRWQHLTCQVQFSSPPLPSYLPFSP